MIDLDNRPDEHTIAATAAAIIEKIRSIKNVDGLTVLIPIAVSEAFDAARVVLEQENVRFVAIGLSVDGGLDMRSFETLREQIDTAIFPIANSETGTIFDIDAVKTFIGDRPLIVDDSISAQFAYADDTEIEKISAMRDKLEYRLIAEISNAFRIGGKNRLPDHLCIGFDGLNGEVLAEILLSKGIRVSTAARCLSYSRSIILESMDVPYGVALGSIRFRLSPAISEDQISAAADAVVESVAHARNLAGHN